MVGKEPFLRDAHPIATSPILELQNSLRMLSNITNSANMCIRKSLGLLSYFLLAALALPAQNADTGLQTESKIIEAGKQKMLGNTAKAKDIYLQILDKQPDNTLAAYELARILLNTGNQTEALKYAGQAAKGDPSNRWYLSFYARVFGEMGRFQEAASIAGQSLKAFPREKQFYLDCALYQEQAGQIQAAVKTLDDLEALFGLQESTVRKKADLYLALRDTKKAAREWEKLVAAYPQHIPYLLLLAGFYTQHGEKEKAIATYRRVLTLDSREPAALSALAGSNSPTSAASIPADIKTLVGNRDLEAGTKISKLKPFAERFAQAKEQGLGNELLTLSAQIEELHPGNALAFAFSGEILAISGNPLDAAVRFKRALDLEENDFGVWEKLLKIFQDQGDAPALLREASNALDIFPNKPSLYYYTALAMYWQENLNATRDNLQEALFIGVQDPATRQEVLALQGLVLSALRDAAGSSKAYSEAQSAFRETPILLARMALGNTENPDMALSAAKRAVELDPLNREAALALGYAFYVRNQLQDALQTLQQVLPSHNPPILELLGNIHFRKGEVQEGLSFWEQAKTNGNASARLLKKISDKQLYE